MYNQRDIIIIPFPYSDLTGAKQRPALILSNDLINKTEDRICCLITSNEPLNGIIIDSLEEGKLPFKSWVKPYRVFTVHEKIIKKKLCVITKNFHNKIIENLNQYIK